MSDFDPYAYVAQSAPAATTVGTPEAFDPYAYVAKGAGSQSGAQVAAFPSGPNPLPQTAGNPEGELLTGAVKGTLMPVAGAALGGLRGIWDIAMGKGGQQAAQDIQSTQQAFTPEATTQTEKAGIEAAQSNWNPLNWPGLAASKAGEFLGKEASEHGASPGVSTLLNILPTAAMSALPVAGMLKGGEAAGEAAGAAKSAGSAETATETAGNAPKTAGTASEAGEAPKAQTVEDTTPEQRQAILEKVGLKTIRQSAVSGNVGDAATDYQMTKYDQPAGRSRAAQFEHELNTLTDHATGIVESTGGTVGMDEDALGNRGATIDRPFSMARDYFKNQTRQLYSIADQRAQGVPVTLNNFMQTLQDDSHMTNQDRVALRGAIGAYARKLGMMDEKGQGIQGTVQNAETMRKFLSGNWTYQ
ncbi:MAG: hypothetical protein KGL39_59300, partial [Patescibacteria group bacterium]|nr:hypothetical protein [Patescibacteria group bacterium]